jgi:hypothetical protein
VSRSERVEVMRNKAFAGWSAAVFLLIASAGAAR